jgi:hypothetical protein
MFFAYDVFIFTEYVRRQKGKKKIELSTRTNKKSMEFER